MKAKIIGLTLVSTLVLSAYANENLDSPAFLEQTNQQIFIENLNVKNQNEINDSFINEATVIPLSGALADSVTTAIAIGKEGLAESNGLINTSPLGLTALFAVKAGMVYYANNQPEHIKKPILKMTAGLWSGVSMNNLLLILGTSNPVSIMGGIVFGVYMYHKESKILERE